MFSEVKGIGSAPSVSFTRPNNTTAYAANDVVGTDAATNMTFTNCAVTAGTHIIITGLTLEIDVNAVPAGMSGFRLHLFNAAPTAITDNSAFNLIAADRSKYLGNIAIDAPSDLGDTIWVDMTNVNKKVRLLDNSTTLYGVLETLAAFTPSAVTVKKVTLQIVEV